MSDESYFCSTERYLYKILILLKSFKGYKENIEQNTNIFQNTEILQEEKPVVIELTLNRPSFWQIGMDGGGLILSPVISVWMVQLI